jgi:hypothetical protein
MVHCEEHQMWCGERYGIPPFRKERERMGTHGFRKLKNKLKSVSMPRSLLLFSPFVYSLLSGVPAEDLKRWQGGY